MAKPKVSQHIDSTSNPHTVTLSQIDAEKSIHKGTVSPTDTTKLWIDTTNNPHTLKTYDGAVWNKVTFTTASEVGAEKAVHIGTIAPTDTTKLWIDTTNNPHTLKTYDGTVWNKVTFTTASEIGAEPAFTKSTGFNLDLGTIAGTVAEGNIRSTATASLVVETRTTDPTSPVVGQMWLRTDL